MKNFVRASLAALALSVAIVPVAVRAQNITTVAGGGPPATVTGLLKTGASVGAPAAVRQDSLGNTYILDNDFSRVYKVDTTGHLTLFAGNGSVGFSGEGGLATNAAMFEPSGMCIDANNNVYVADSDNAIIREIVVSNPTAGQTVGHIYTVAGVETEANFTYGGDTGLATAANLHFPDGCSFDSHGNMFIADRGNNAIRVVAAGTTPPTGVTGPTIAGHIYLYTGSIPAGGNPPAFGYAANGAPTVGAALNGPFDVFVDSHDNVFIADLGNPGTTGNNVVREVPAATGGGMTAGSIYTVAGVQGQAGPSVSGVSAITAKLNGPEGIFVDAAGNLFFADNSNQVIREVPAATGGGMTAGFIYDIAGHGTAGYAGDGGPATSASLTHPSGTFVVSVNSTATPTGTLLIADEVNDRVRQVITGTINTFAGNGSTSFSDGTPATAAQLNSPAGVSVDPAGDVLIADVGASGDTQSLIRMVANPVASGALTTPIGQAGFNGFVNTAPFVENNALSVYSDASGTYIADTGNCIVRKFSAGVMTTVAGLDPTIDVNNPPNSTPNCGFAAQGGVAVGTLLGAVSGVVVDASGNIFFSDATNNVVWEVSKVTGIASIVAGVQSTTGSFTGDGPAISTHLDKPTGVTLDIFGNLFIADTGNNVVREVPVDNVGTMTVGNIYIVAGDNVNHAAGYTGEGAVAVGAQMNAPAGMAVDHADNIFIADTNNHIIREVAAATAGGMTAGHIYRVGGTAQTPGFAGDGGAAKSAQLKFPGGVTFDGSGNLLISDTQNNRVRSVAALGNEAAVPVASFDQTTLTFVGQTLNTPSQTQSVKLTNSGGAILSGIAVSITGTNAGDFTQTNTCTATLAANANCSITVTFTPTVVGVRTAKLSIADNAFGNPQSVILNGTGQVGAPVLGISPTSLTFASQAAHSSSMPQAVTLSNTGSVALTFTGITIVGPNAADFTLGSATTCSGTGTLNPAATCVLSVVYNPAAAGTSTAMIMLTGNIPAGSQTISLGGTATAAALTLNLGAASGGSTSQTVPAGQTATYALQISANQNASVTFTCTGAPTAATCTVPATAVAVTAGTPAAVSVTVSTTARGMLGPQSEPATRMQPPVAIQMLPVSVLAMLLLIATLLATTQSPAGRLRLARAALSACLLLMPIAAATLLVGCGGGSSSSTTPPPATGTAAGTYTVVVTAKSGSQTASTNLTLIVQ
jgi:sugar lactone lactonase YvrE